MRLMVLGTSSNAGKTTINAVICRYMTRNGVDAVPYKALNLSLNSYVTDTGAEIGMGQALQAWACGIEPEAEMNPILLKPFGGGRIQYVIDGKVHSEGRRPDTQFLVDRACAAFDRLQSEHDSVICEGSGSPVELNLMDRDIANLRMAKERDMDIILVGDIERGGVYAALYGTWLLIPEDQRPRVRGFIINRFRGDDSILGPANEELERLTGMRCLGIMPYTDVLLPEEDTLSEKRGSVRFEDARKVYMESLDRLTDLAEKSLDLDYLMSLGSN